MPAFSPCNLIQERIVAGDALDETSQAHTLACASCARVVAGWLALDSAIADGIEASLAVPDGFVDRVMAGLAAEGRASTRLERVFGRPWVRVALANIGLAVAVANLLRMLFSTLLPVASLGGTP